MMVQLLVAINGLKFEYFHFFFQFFPCHVVVELKSEHTYECTLFLVVTFTVPKTFISLFLSDLLRLSWIHTYVCTERRRVFDFLVAFLLMS